MLSILLSYVSDLDDNWSNSVCITILITRWGGNIGSLQISAVQNTPSGQSQVLLWQRNETQAREWRTGQVNLRDIPYDFAIQIDGFVGSGWEGDVWTSKHILHFFV